MSLKNWCFCAPNLGEGPPKFFGAFVNRHYFLPTGQVWLISHDWSFIYADKVKISAVKYKGLAFGGHKIGTVLDSQCVYIYHIQHNGKTTTKFMSRPQFNQNTCTSILYAYLPTFKKMSQSNNERQWLITATINILNTITGEWWAVVMY